MCIRDRNNVLYVGTVPSNNHFVSIMTLSEGSKEDYILGFEKYIFRKTSMGMRYNLAVGNEENLLSIRSWNLKVWSDLISLIFPNLFAFWYWICSQVGGTENVFLDSTVRHLSAYTNDGYFIPMAFALHPLITTWHKGIQSITDITFNPWGMSTLSGPCSRPQHVRIWTWEWYHKCVLFCTINSKFCTRSPFAAHANQIWGGGG